MKKEHNNLPIDWVKEKLVMLRQELETSGKWPKSADQLWFDLTGNQTNNTEEGDEIMISVVVSDAVNGIDIAERYPEFYRRMLQNPEIFQAFLDAVEVLEADAAGLLETPPATEASVPDVIFSGSRPIIQRVASGAWLARWRQTVEELNALFNSFNPILSPEFRNGLSILEEGAMPLIRSETTIEDRDFGVLLTASWTDDPDKLQLQLSVALMPDDSTDFELSSLRAGLHWGAYSKVCAVDEYGRAIFPPLPIRAITDKTGRAIKSDLQLLLHPTT